MAFINTRINQLKVSRGMNEVDSRKKTPLALDETWTKVEQDYLNELAREKFKPIPWWKRFWSK